MTTKKEAVKLPSFSGDERYSPYLKFPVWKKQWEIIISEYDEKWRSGLLWDHLDDVAREKYVGWETDYKEAMKRLERCYADPKKVISCVMKEVLSVSLISDGDYKNLIYYSLILENNYNRLCSLGLEHEISNTSSMSAILKKFPRLVGEKWSEFLCSLDHADKIKPIIAFIKWLEMQREIWETMVANDFNPKKKDFSLFSSGHYGEQMLDKFDQRSCYFCGEEGHIKRNCPTRGKERGKPVIKQFWCAYHKDD